MFYLQLIVRPTTAGAAPKDLTDPAGAYLNCWIDSEDLEEAKAQVEKFLQENGWRLELCEENYCVDESSYEANPEGLKFYMEALANGECYVFHKWPLADEEDSVRQ